MKTGWQIILIVIPVVEVTQEWFKWIFIDTVTLQWHSGSALGGLKFV